MFWKIIVVGVFLPLLASASEGFGLGVILGTPNGVSARQWLGEKNSIDAGAGWSLSKSRFQANSSYLFTEPNLINLEEETFDLSYGLGVSLRNKSGKQDGEVVFGPRLPVILSYEFRDPSVEVFLQAALNLGLIPSSDVYFDANLGVRFYIF